jgi:choline dehydrogenase-like flavoprotein
MPAHADVVVVGAGAAGGALTWRLATGGVDVVCLEQGGWVDTADDVPHLDPRWELSRQTTHHPSPNVRRNAWDYPVDETASPIKLLMYNAVGGSTIHWGAHFPRFHPSDFATRTLDGVGDDWPLTYADLEPFYDLNDRMTGVSGLAGDSANPPRSPRQMPPLPLGEGGTRLAAAFDRLGWHWWPVDAAIATRPYDGRGACNMCGPCDLGCPTRARASTDVTYWPKALAVGARLVTGARVSGIEVDASGRATGVTYLGGDGREHRQSADVVVLAANGVGTARLLLMSASPRFPEGLANRSGLVGCNLMHHPTGMVTGVFDDMLDGYRGPFAVSILSQEFYESSPDRPFRRGFQMQLVRSDGPLGTALGGYLPRVPWGAGHHAAFVDWFARTASLTVTTEDLPDPENRVTLDPSLTDSSGLPAPRVQYRVSDNTWAMLDWGAQRATEAMVEAGARRVLHQRLVAMAGFHLLGTARMGTDPDASVVDPWGRTHDVANLHIVDGSVFVTAAALNPTSTIQALALRAADRLLATARSGAVAPASRA